LIARQFKACLAVFVEVLAIADVGRVLRFESPNQTTGENAGDLVAALVGRHRVRIARRVGVVLGHRVTSRAACSRRRPDVTYAARPRGAQRLHRRCIERSGSCSASNPKQALADRLAETKSP
jgi:hypothetical protein